MDAKRPKYTQDEVISYGHGTFNKSAEFAV